MKGFSKGFFVGLFILLLTNFIWGYMGKLTYENAKNYVEGKVGDEKVDTLSDEDINLSIAKTLQEKYGADSLMVNSIGTSLTKYDYYISGVKGTKELEDKTQRLKKVTFSKGSLQYRVNIFYNCTNGNVDKIENDDTPLPNSTEVSPITPLPNTSVPNLKPTQTDVKDTTNVNNHNVGEPSNGGADYNNNSDV